MGRVLGVGATLGVGVTLGVVVAVGVAVGETNCAQYLPPVFRSLPGLLSPPQMIISLPVHTAVCRSRASGAWVVLVAVHVSVLGLYLPPVLKRPALSPPQTIISLPVHTAVWFDREDGASVILVAVQLSVLGLYLPPV